MFGFNCVLDGVQITEVHQGKLETRGARANLVEQSQGAAIKIRRRDHVCTAVKQIEYAGRRRHAGTVGNAVIAGLQLRGTTFQGFTRRVARARVVVLLPLTKISQLVGRGRIDWRHHGAGRFIDGVSRVDTARREILLVVLIAHIFCRPYGGLGPWATGPVAHC